MRRRLNRTAGMTVLVGGVGELFQGDLDLGRLAAERLRTEQFRPNVLIEELHYGAVAVSQRLEELRPSAFVMVGAVHRGRPAGTVQRSRVSATHSKPDEVQAAVGDAVTGYVSIDLIIEVAGAFGALPPRTVAIEVEPAWLGPGEGLSPAAQNGLSSALQLVRAEVERQPLFCLVDELDPLLVDDRITPCPALDVIRALLTELRRLDRDGDWGATFALRDRLRCSVVAGSTGEGMDAQDWALWWVLLEELDRLQALDASEPAES